MKTNFKRVKKKVAGGWNSLTIQWLGLSIFTTVGPMPGLESKTPKATWCDKGDKSLMLDSKMKSFNPDNPAGWKGRGV